MTAASVPTGAKRRCESQGQERHQGKPANMNTQRGTGQDAAPARVVSAFPGPFCAATPTGAAIPVKSRKKRKSGDNSGPARTMTRPGHFERKNAVFPKSRAGKKRQKRPLLRDGAKIKGKERRT